MKSKSFKISLCAMVTALSTVVMMLTGLITIGSYALPAIAGIFMVIIVIEINKKWAFATYISTSMLSVFLASDKEAVIIFILFFGYYPILKALIERLKNKVIIWILKFLVFNVSAITYYIAALKILMLPDDSFTIFGVSLPLFFLMLGNIVFLLYDYTLSLLVKAYIFRVHPKLRKIVKNDN